MYFATPTLANSHLVTLPLNEVKGKGLDSSVKEFTLSRAEVLPHNDRNALGDNLIVRLAEQKHDDASGHEPVSTAEKMIEMA